MKFYPERTPEEETRIAKVWEKGQAIPGQDFDEWRRDDFGNNIRFDDYGNRDSEFGWEIDHIVTVADGGTDDINNLRPLHWRENLARNKLYPRSPG